MFGKRKKQKELTEVFTKLFSMMNVDYEKFNVLYPISTTVKAHEEFEYLSAKYNCTIGYKISGNYHVSVTGICNLISKILIDEHIEFIFDEERKFLKINFLKD